MVITCFQCRMHHGDGAVALLGAFPVGMPGSWLVHSLHPLIKQTFGAPPVVLSLLPL